MPPKRKVKSEESEEEEPFVPSDEEVDDEDFVIDDSEEEKPKKKRAPPKKRPPAKKPAKAAAEEGGDGAKPKPKRAKPAKITGITDLGNGWIAQPPSLLYKLNPAAQGGTKVACYDMDGTLIGVKSGAQFPRTAEDWKWFNREVALKLKEAHDQGYQLLIISNQGGVKGALGGAMSDKVRGRCDLMLADLNKQAGAEVPVQVVMATQRDGNRKPETGMWDFFVQNANKGVQPDLSQSYYVGDAAGREGDIQEGADSDKQFAANVGLTFFTPEEKFGESTLKAGGGGGGGGGDVKCPENAGLAAAFRKLADLVSGEPFKANAFKKVAGIIEEWEEPIKSAKDLKDAKGVGKSSQAKITEFLETGTLAALQEVGMTAGAANASAEIGLKFV